MRTQATDSLAAWPAELTPPHGVLVLTGYGLDVRVWRGRLRVADGIGHDRREAIVHRATGRLRRLVVLGHTGSVTLEAIRWLADVGVGYLQIDADGRVLAAFGPQGTDRPGLRRAQARALDTPTGNDIVRRLLAEKVAGQAANLAALTGVGTVTDETVDALRMAAQRLHVGVTRDDLRLAESQAAAAYWSAWAPVPVRFARRDADRVPAHWRTFGGRAPPLTGNPRLAGNPANALLNVLYACLEAEATLAARVVGLDPGVGLLHADQPNRDSLAADLMEPLRPVVDRYLLRLLTGRVFAAADFYETRQGVCRVTPPLARELAEASADWLAPVGRVAEDVARLLDQAGTGNGVLATPLTGRNRSAGRGRHSKSERLRRPPTVRRGCAWCGATIASGRATCSTACEQAARAEQLPRFIEAGRHSLERQQSEGLRPEMSPAGREHVGKRSSELTRAAREWQRTHRWPSDPDRYEREVRPALAALSAGAIAQATGLSVGYCRHLRAGRAVAHPMWWEALLGLRAHRDGAPGDG